MILQQASILSVLLLSATTVSSLPQRQSEPQYGGDNPEGRSLHARAPAPLTIPIVRRAGIEKRDRSIEEWAALSSGIKSKFGGGASSKAGKRELVTVSTTNQQLDTSYFGQIHVGTPPQPYNVILDTGSADLWLASVQCAQCAAQSTGELFSTTSSSSFSTITGSLDVTYGSGSALGTLGQDVVSLGGFQVSNQAFGVATQVSNSFLTGNISGLMGLGFQSLASTQALPWWEAASAAWTNPQMSFYLTRFRNSDKSNDNDEPGGQFTMGGTNSSLYDGDISYTNLVKAQYWTIPMTAIGTQGGQSVSISSDTQNAAIDTGTTLIGGPSSVLDQFYSGISGAVRGSSFDPQLQDYYLVPCDTNVQAQLTFGGKVYTMTADDLIGGTVSRQYCLGAFFILDIGGSSSPIPGATSSVPSWVVGSAFLKNVYTVFQSNPAAVGFATLKANAQNIGMLGPAGFSIDQSGNTNGTIIAASSALFSTVVPSASALVLVTGLLGASLTAALGLL